MGGCTDCQALLVDGLVGREAWRQARLVEPTGVTGPAGVVQNMADPTGSFSAIVEREWSLGSSGQRYSLCSCDLPGISAQIRFGFINGLITSFRDGVVRLATLASSDLTSGVWIKAEVLPNPFATVDNVTRKPLPFTLAISGPPSVDVESGEFVLAERGEWGYLRSLPPAVGLNRTGPLRITAGYGDTVVHEVYDAEFGIDFLGYYSELNVDLALLPFQALDRAANGPVVRVCAAFSVSRGLFASQTFCLPIPVPSEYLLGDVGLRASADLHNGVSLEVDPSRMAGRVTQPIRGPMLAVGLRNVIGNNRTDVIVPLDATGPEGVEVPLTTSADRSLFAAPLGPLSDYDEGPFSRRAFANAKSADRPDRNTRTYCRAIDGPTWHERNIIRYGSSLGIDGARHQFALTCDWSLPSPSSYVTVNGLGQLSVWPTIGILGGMAFNLLPVMQGRSLLPTFYASGPVVGGAISISSAPIIAGGTASVDVEVQPIVHAFAMSSLWSVSGAPPSYSTLPLPGENGMTLDDYNIWQPTLAYDPNLTGGRNLWTAQAQLDVSLDAWVKITVRSVSTEWQTWSGNHVTYRKLPEPSRFLLLFDDAQCHSLGNQQELADIRPATLVLSQLGAAYPTSGDPFRVQFSMYQPE